jgi:hypothetical protein
MARCTGIGPIVFREHASDDILVNLKTKHKGQLLSNPPAAEARISGFHLDDGSNDLF